MNKQIIIDEIKDNHYFWYMYLKWFRGFDDKNELNLDEAMEVIDIDKSQLYEWEESFFADISEDSVKFIAGKLNDEMSFNIAFHESEIVFFLNEIYIGNLGGHFEAWFLTWEELLTFGKSPFLFLLLLPMTGIEKDQIDEAKDMVVKHLKMIYLFEKDAMYLAYCIMNGLVIDENFSDELETGILNNQNHSVRNLGKYPRYKDDVKSLNVALSKFVAQS